MLVNLKNRWSLRPSAATNIPNLMLASDYVKTYSDLACMDGADEAARRATNSIIDHSGSSATPCDIYPFQSPTLLKVPQAIDRVRWKLGLPWKNPVGF